MKTNDIAQYVKPDAVWQRWSPSDSEPWNLQRVVHLHRRAGFAGTWKEIKRDLDDGHDAAIKRFLNGTAYESHVPGDFDSLAELIGTSAVGSDNPNRLQAWWFYRMLYSPDPLGERLALMWHNHFATSHAKVRNLRVMHRQNQLFRKYGRDKFATLLEHVIKDPAILIYLDADSNRASHPNENLGREMLELFTMGEGNYTEDDVRNAARSLTGWTVKNEAFHFENDYHDPSEKTVLGKSGKFRGEDAVRIAVGHSATAKRIAWRVCQMLMGENVVNDAQLSELANQFRDNNMNIGWLVDKILGSKLFFSNQNIGNRVRSGAEFIVSFVRGISAHQPPPSTLVLVDWSAKTGHRLFHPPNVFGFPAGRQWITPAWLLARKKFAIDLLAGRLHRHEFDAVDSFRQSTGADIADDADLILQLIGNPKMKSAHFKTEAEVARTPETPDSDSKPSNSDSRRPNSGESGYRNELRAILQHVLTSPLASLG